MWIVTVALVSARQARVRAVVLSFLVLLAAVVAFFYGKKVVYDIKYPGAAYSVDGFQLLEWGLLAAVAGALLGVLFAGIGRAGRAGSIATGSAVGLLAADALRRAINYHDQAPMLIAFAVVAIAAVLLAAVRDLR